MSEGGLLSVLSIEELKLLSAVKVQGLWCPASSTSKRLGEFVSPVFEIFPDELYEIGSLSSCVRIQFGGRFLIVATQHQFRDRQTRTAIDPERIGLRSDTERSYLTSSGFYRAEESNLDKVLDHHDLCFLDFTGSVENGFFRRDRFLKIERVGSIKSGESIVGGVVYGYAFQDQEWDHDETGDLDYRLIHVGNRLRESVCSYLGEGVDSSSSKWEVKGSKDFDPDGMSGGAVFALVNHEGAFEAKFAGLLARGSNGIFHSINVDSVVKYLNSIFPLK